MSSEVTNSDSKALTVQQRATLALGLADVEKTLTALAESSKSITAITNNDGYDQCHAARMQLVRERLHITKRGKEAREDAQKFSKAVIAEEGRLVALIEPEEKRLQKLQDAHDAEVAAAKEARIAAELKRVEDLQERVAELRGNRTLSAMSGAALIAEHLSDLEAIQIDDTFSEFRQAAEDAKASGLSWLNQVHAAAVAHEAEQQRIKDEREELARHRAESARRDAEERAKREAEEATASKARQEEERRAAEQRARQKAEDDRMAAERKAILDAQEAEAKVAREAEARRQEAQRHQNEMRMSEINGIQQQVMIATLGRDGVRKGGTLECYQVTLAETEAWPIEESNFGPMTAMAQKVKDSAIASIREGMAAFRQRQADKAESDRIAADRAALEREQEAARKVQEPAPVTRRGAPVQKPTAADIIAVLTKHYRAHPDTITDWLVSTNFAQSQDAA